MADAAPSPAPLAAAAAAAAAEHVVATVSLKGDGAEALAPVPLGSLTLEVANTLLFSFLATELLLRKRPLREVRIHFLVLLVANLILSARVIASVGAILSLMIGEVGDVASWMGAVAASGVFTAAAVSSPVLRCLLRLTAVATGFSALAYYDIRHMRQQPYLLPDFLKELKAALLLVLPVYPCLVVACSCLFLVFVSILQKVDLITERFGEEVIFYGQFYAPFSAIYWSIKKDWLEHGGSPILPLKGRGSSEAGRQMTGRRA
eukprot:TRINITY_DN32430_c0_g1_i1.p1 TRINITY_DN32430_c0_g1~~TRINITY_DN32430_c0_g1_i1.p1  ORF type:complete len:262 (+),score=53.33 TRINITY_DN32430_c0_g1_i1:76-861(+)